MEKKKRMQFTMRMWTCMPNGTFSHLDEGLFSTVSWYCRRKTKDTYEWSGSHLSNSAKDFSSNHS